MIGSEIGSSIDKFLSFADSFLKETEEAVKTGVFRGEKLSDLELKQMTEESLKSKNAMGELYTKINEMQNANNNTK